jgi:hypothetical protein
MFAPAINLQICPLPNLPMATKNARDLLCFLRLISPAVGSSTVICQAISIPAPRRRLLTMESLMLRFDSIVSRMEALELSSTGASPQAAALARRQAALLDRVAALEAALGVATPPAASGDGLSNQEEAAVPMDTAAEGIRDGKGDESSVSEVQRRLASELRSLGVAHRFVRAPGDYYDRPLEFRRDVVGAGSIHHLCKSIIMENTRAPVPVRGAEAGNPALGTSRRVFILEGFYELLQHFILFYM